MQDEDRNSREYDTEEDIKNFEADDGVTRSIPFETDSFQNASFTDSYTSGSPMNKAGFFGGFENSTEVGFWEAQPSYSKSFDTDGSMAFDDTLKDNSFDSLSDLFDSNFGGDFLVDLEDDVERIEDEAPPCPDYFDRNCSFCTRVEAKLTLPVMEEALRDAKCDNLEINETHFQIRGTYYMYYSSVSFAVNVFRRQDDVLVEVQRLCGDSLGFSQFYNHLLAAVFEALAPYTYDGGEIKFSKKASFETPSLPSQPPIQLSKRSLDPVVQMSKSSFVETQREAALVLARVSSVDANKETLSNEETVFALKSLLSSADVDVWRCAVTCMANLIHQATFVDSCVNELLPCLFELVTDTSLRTYNEALRQICKILLQISLEHASTLRRYDFISSLRVISRTSEDMEVSKLSRSVCENLVV